MNPYHGHFPCRPRLNLLIRPECTVGLMHAGVESGFQTLESFSTLKRVFETGLRLPSPL